MDNSMKCHYCANLVESKWSYCPVCGHKVDHQSTFVNLINKHLDQIRKRFSTQLYDKNTKESTMGNITISITTGFGSPKISAGTNKSQDLQHYEARKNKTAERTQPKEIIEPEIIMKKTGDDITVDAHLPGVKSENDVEINAMSNSVELRAYAGDKGYFKILNIPNSFDLVDKKLKDEKLRLQFSV